MRIVLRGLKLNITKSSFRKLQIKRQILNTRIIKNDLLLTHRKAQVGFELASLAIMVENFTAGIMAGNTLWRETLLEMEPG
jgi:hypothetical protein